MGRQSLAVILATSLLSLAWLLVVHLAVANRPAPVGAGLLAVAWGLAGLGAAGSVLLASRHERRRRRWLRWQKARRLDPQTTLATLQALEDDLGDGPRLRQPTRPAVRLLMIHLRGLERREPLLSPADTIAALAGVTQELTLWLGTTGHSGPYRPSAHSLAVLLHEEVDAGRLTRLQRGVRRVLESSLTMLLNPDDLILTWETVTPPAAVPALVERAARAARLAAGRQQTLVHLCDEPGEQQRRQEQIRRALLHLSADDLELRFQPILWLARPGQLAVEILSRFRHSPLAELGTGAVFEAAQEMGLAHRIDDLVLGQLAALERSLAARRWLDGRLDHVSVNLSSETVADETRLNRLIERVKEITIDPTRFCIEITETAATREVGQGQSLVTASERLIKELNLKICIDDFGSGLSNYQRICQAWYDIIKIDLDLVSGISSSFRLQRYLGSFIQTAHSLGKTVVAEGVENRSDLAAVVRLGVDAVQGFLIAGSLSLDELTRFASSSRWTEAEALQAQLDEFRRADPLTGPLPLAEADPATAPMPLERYILHHWSSLRSFEEFVLLYAQELRSWGLSLMRLSLAFLPDQDDLHCNQFIWTRDRPGDVQILDMDASFLQRPEHLSSPLHYIATRAPIYRQRLASCRDLDFPFLEELRTLGCHDYLGLRLNSRGVSVPVLTIALAGESVFSDDQVQRIQRMSNLFGLLFHAFESDRARRLALLDPLTSLANRRSFDRTLRLQGVAAETALSPLALALIDIDRFKAVNDGLGHAYGDECLRRVANLLTDTLGSRGDLVARLGGEEFAVILPDSDAATARRSGERLRRAVERAGLRQPAGDLPQPLTISIGIAVWQPGQACDTDQLQQLADQCLYEAKDAGRNRVICRALQVIQPIQSTPR
ncbi:MAG: GGDEF domain-containing protein [Cyanobacteriota bacterium]|nr:GGDEF domain-containing protein [Cyanobacteriota bacterium]